MAKYSNINRFSQISREELFLSLVDALAGMDKTAAAKLLRDLLSEQETSMIARRLKIAALLEAGLSYEQIRKEIAVSHSTIAKIQLWLKTYGDGLRAAIPKIKNHEVPKGPPQSASGWRQIKKRYPGYFWPQLMLETIVKGASKKQRQTLLRVMAQLHEKTPLTKQLEKILGKTSYTT